MNILLRLKHWQVFASLLVVGTIGKFFDNTEPIGRVANSSATLFLILWFVLLSILLKGKLGSKLSLLFIWSLICSLILAAGIVTILCIYRTNELFLLVEDRSLFFSAWGLSFFLFLNLAIFPAKALRLLENGENITTDEVLGDIVRLVFWPLGIWSIQPRLNKLLPKWLSR